MKKSLLLLFGLGLLTLAAHGQSQLGLSVQDMLSSEEQAITDRARLRKYPGGVDEEPIQIQAEVKATATEDEADAGTPQPATEEMD